MMRLKHILRLQYGSALASERRGDGNVFVYGSNGVIGMHSHSNMQAPAIVIGRKGSHGKVTWAQSGGFCIDTALFVDKRHSSADLRYSYYLLQTLGLDNPSKDSAVPGLDRMEAHNCRISHIDIDTQQVIADFLDRETVLIDQLIDRRYAFLHLLEEKKAALAVKAINGEILDYQMDGSQGWFGHVPKDWPVRRAKFLFRERQDRSCEGCEELLSVSHITGVTKRSEKDVNMFLAETMEGYKLVRSGDVVINTMWAWMGAMGVSAINGMISPSYGVYMPIDDSYDPKYLDLLLRSRPFIAEVNRRSKGVWSSRLRLYPDAFLDIRMPVPSLIVQQKIMEILEAALHHEDKIAELSVKSIASLREFRSTLITAAVTGQIDVTTWRKRGTTERQLAALNT